MTVRAGGMSCGGTGGYERVRIGGMLPGPDRRAPRRGGQAAPGLQGASGGAPTIRLVAVVLASDLGKDIAGEPLLRGVSFKLERRDRMTLSGRNGSGKTTLLRMLSGEASVDFGELVFAKGAKLALHDQRPPRDRELSLREYILSGAAELVAIETELASLEQAMAGGAHDEATLDRYSRAQARLEHAGGYDWRDRALSTLRGLGFRDGADLDRQLSTFSGGELTRASLGRALAGAPDLLLLDEPTNHLDIESLEWLEQHLIALDAAVVLVAHDRWFLEAVGTSVLELEGGRSRFFAGPWHAWRKEKAARELALGRAIERQEAEIERLERFVTRFRAGTRARQAQSRAKRLDKIDRITRDPTAGVGLEFAFKPPERTGRVVFELEDATLQAGEKSLLRGAELWLERGEHVSLVGANGTGKTTLIETLAGQRELPEGKLRTGHNVQLGYISQHAEELNAGTARTVLEAAQHATGLTPGKTRALLGRFLFSGEDAEKPLDGLSGGERRRLSLAVLVHSGANVLILDEPTNHLDLESREALEAALKSFPGTLLLVSHDRALLDAIGTRTVALEDQTLHSYVGGWPEYLRVREERAKAPTPAKAAKAAETARVTETAGPRSAGANTGARGNGVTATAQNTGRKRTPPRPKGARKGAGNLEQQIEAAEAELRAIEDELTDPAAWATPAATARSTARHEAARHSVAELYERWEVAG
jgi:ATP-binding cassette, subfamily F, member 3